MKRLQTIKQFSFVVPLVVTTLLWLLSKTRFHEEWNESLPQLVSQIFSLWALMLFSMALIIAARSRTVERLYGGLDKSYKTHALLAKIGFALMLAHPILLIPHYIWQGEDWLKLFWFSDFWPRNVGIASFYLFVLLVVITLFRFLEYQRWLLTHKVTGIAFTLASVHALNAQSDIKSFEPLRDWMLFFMILGFLAWVYKTFFYCWAAKKYAYRVHDLKPMGQGIFSLAMEPLGARINFEPGEFIFISVLGHPSISSEPHPFSIGSIASRKCLRIGYREVGDYTRSLRALQPGDRIEVYGPYGEFTSYNLDGYKRQVWIGGGIGITPFLAMLEHEATNEDHKQIWLFYGVKTMADAVFDAELRCIADGHEDELHYIPFPQDTEGLISGERILKEVGSFDGVAVLMCGPMPMMQAIKKQLVELGMDPSDIFFEEFNFV